MVKYKEKLRGLTGATCVLRGYGSLQIHQLGLLSGLRMNTGVGFDKERKRPEKWDDVHKVPKLTVDGAGPQLGSS